MIGTFECIKNTHNVYRSKECMKTFCESLRELKNFNIIFIGL